MWIQTGNFHLFLQVKTDQAGDMTVRKVLSSLKRHGLQHRLKSDITGSRLSIPLQHQPINRTCATDVVEFVVPELHVTTIKDDADDTRTHGDEIRRSTAHSMTFIQICAVRSNRVRFGRSRSSKVDDFSANRKRVPVCDFLLVGHCDYGRSLHRF